MRRSIKTQKSALRNRAKALRALYGSEVLSRRISRNVFSFIREKFFDLPTIGCYNAIGNEVNLNYLYSILNESHGFVVPIVTCNSMFFEKEIHLILIPMVAFDMGGNRLGYGGGYYDRFLKGKDMTKVGIGYSFQCMQSLPRDTHDESMDWIITERGIHSFKHV